MSTVETLTAAFGTTAFLVQIILIVHFALRRWRFDLAVRYGWWVYALGLAAAAVSLWLMLAGVAWQFWLGGFLYLIWGLFGYWIEYIRQIEWRQPIYWPVFGPYILLYLAMIMFYWFPLLRISKPLWYVYAILYCISTILNVTSHKRTGEKMAIPSGDGR